MFQLLRKEGIPHVLLDRRFKGFASHFVGVNDEFLGYVATRHLIEIGCQRIAHISAAELSPLVGRLEGYKRALAEYGLVLGPEYVTGTGRAEEVRESAGYDAVNELLRVSPRPDAIFCFNDHVAMGAMRAILDAGLRIPTDIALLGCGNFHFDDYLRVSLGGMDQQSAAIDSSRIVLGRTGRSDFTSLIASRAARMPKLIRRDSTRR